MEAGQVKRGKEWLAPLTGVVFVALLAATLILGGEGVDPKDGTREVLDYYSDNEDEVLIASFLGGVAAIFFLFFAGWLRKVLREAEGPGGVLSAVSFAGAIIFAGAGAFASTLGIALAESFDDIDPSAVEAMNAISWNFFIPFAVGGSTFILAAGISVVRHGALPRWLGWAGVVLGIASYTPAGFFAFLLILAWILVASVLLAMRARAAA
jgi:vacuolar-type H+-ATPase subunit I/STV1